MTTVDGGNVTRVESLRKQLYFYGLNKMETVKSLFLEENIDVDFIERKFEGPYWEKCGNFVFDVWELELESLTDKQYIWLKNILEDCVEKRIQNG